MRKAIAALLEGIAAWAISLHGIIWVTVFLTAVGVAMAFWHILFTPVFFTSVKAFATKTFPQWIKLTIKSSLPLIPRALASKYLRAFLAFVILSYLSREEKRQILASKDRAIRAAHKYTIRRPQLWWRRKSPRTRTIIVSTLTLATLTVLAISPYFSKTEAVLYAIFFFWRSIAGVILWIIQQFAPAFTSAAITGFVHDRVAPFLSNLVPNWVKHSRCIHFLATHHFVTTEKIKGWLDKKSLVVRTHIRAWRDKQTAAKAAKALKQETVEETD
ncbi:MAG: hypothetical protein KC877_04625 [Candidatus Kaiserbacteria bacterium]|nr:hypothetical protein [Candidatus Kaiserbacteria bacterium]MCB9816696.1 hypothetical protein [Candidatus Nomurabacteria bacterium]